MGCESVSQPVIASYPNFTELNEQILQITRNSAEKLIGIVNTLSNLQDISTSTERVVVDNTTSSTGTLSVTQ